MQFDSCLIDSFPCGVWKTMCVVKSINILKKQT